MYNFFDSLIGPYARGEYQPVGGGPDDGPARWAPTPPQVNPAPSPSPMPASRGSITITPSTLPQAAPVNALSPGGMALGTPLASPPAGPALTLPSTPAMTVGGAAFNTPAANITGSAAAMPASIRTNNPGAQWPGASASRFGADSFQQLRDGNKIAVFPTPVHGAAAQFDLLDKRYGGMTLGDAITKWSGGNSSAGYATAVSRATGIGVGERITKDLLRSPRGIALARAMAAHEAGRPYPLSIGQWAQAQQMAFNSQSE